MAGTNVPRAGEIRADGYVLAFTIGVSLAAGVLFGLAPAFQISRPDLNAVLRTEGRGATGNKRHGMFRNALVVTQVALSTILLVGAGLLVRNFLQMRNTNQGFDTGGLLTMNVSLPPTRYAKPPDAIAFWDELLRQLRGVPGVRSAAIASALPANPARFSPALPEGQPEVELAQRPVFNIQTIGPGYAETMRLPLVAGRGFNEHDERTAPPVIMVNQTVARRYWPTENPVGKHIALGRMPKAAEIVGVLGDIRNNSLAADVAPEIYLPYSQFGGLSMNLLVRTEGDPHGMVAAVRGRVLAVDKDQPVTAVQTMEEVLDSATSQSRFTTTLLGGLAAMALILALVGIYGVIGYTVAERTREMGIRMALGAERTDILRLVLRQGMTLVLAGIGIGLGASVGLTRLMGTLLYRVSATDPAIYSAGAVLFVAVAALASYLPARRATRVDPMVALRWE